MGSFHCPPLETRGATNTCGPGIGNALHSVASKFLPRSIQIFKAIRWMQPVTCKAAMQKSAQLRQKSTLGATKIKFAGKMNGKSY